MLKEYTAAQLAAELDHVPSYDPQYTGPLSMLDEATAYWATRYPQLAEAQRAYSNARHQQWPRTATADTWAEVVRTAGVLADALRPLGHTRLSFCRERGSFSRLEMDCTGVLDGNGECRYSANHI